MKRNEVFLQATYVAEKVCPDCILVKIHQDAVLTEDEDDFIPENDFYVRIKSDLIEEYMSLHLEEGDVLSVIGGKIYAKNGSVFIKITSMDELVKHSRPRVLDLGIESPEEKFI